MTDGSGPAAADELHRHERDGWEPPLSPFAAVPPPAVGTGKDEARLGRVAMVMAILVAGVSLLWSVLVGLFGTTIYQYNDVSSQSFHVGFNMQPNLIAAGIQILLGTVFGIWALVQGIVAAATNRGRKFGVVAIVVAGAAPLLSLIMWSIVGLIFGTHVAM